ncbi:MAG: glycosyltransferase family 4 protein [Ferruginibacter sp.]|nr:glycosyltransferase family 4 protein [Ferruginibacter sp.]
MSRVAGMALYEYTIGRQGRELRVFSMYDEQGDVDEKYFPAPVFKGFHKKKIRFVYEAVRLGIGCREVILSHSNLLLAGFLVKVFSPQTKLILLAHGIEVWQKFPFWKNYMLGKCDRVLAVSRFTKTRMMALHGIAEKKITVLNNCLDPFLQVPPGERENPDLLARYGLTKDNIVLLTITRLSFKEQYKGYDNVLYAIEKLKEKYPGIRYMVVGKYDEEEKSRLEAIILALKLEDNIVFTGFIADRELAAHYNIADLYIMPSKKEGFGIVFIEAMYYGKPVIAGNKDGSADALDDGNLGLLVNPDDANEIAGAITRVIRNKTAFIPDPKQVMEKFSYPVYREKFWKVLEEPRPSPFPSSTGPGFPGD